MIWLSLGENCLADDILKRFGLKSFSTPFSPSRTNIEYVMQGDQEDFAQLLDPELLTYEDVWGDRVVKNRTFKSEKGLYHVSVDSGFEFTHHDVKSDAAKRDSFQRKVERWNQTRRSGGEVIFLYHHRDWMGKNISKLAAKLAAFQSSYERDGTTCSIILLDQSVAPNQPRACTVEMIGQRLVYARVVTQNQWSGKDKDVFWGRVDNDLLSIALQKSAALLGCHDPIMTLEPPPRPAPAPAAQAG